MKMIALAMFIMCATATFVFAGERALPMKVFGVTVGAPLDIPKCTDDNGVGTVVECWYRNPYTGKDEVDIATPTSSPLPSWVKNLSAQIIDGRVEGIHVVTLGADVQQAALKSLVTKYGKPDRLDYNDVQTIGGAPLHSIGAYWQSGKIAVLFTGIDHTLNNGYVRMVTPAWLAHSRGDHSSNNETEM